MKETVPHSQDRSAIYLNAPESGKISIAILLMHLQRGS